MIEFYDNVKERMLRYAKINTQSDRNSDRWPTTKNQMDLARVLADEMHQMGVKDVYLDEKNCVTYGKLPSNLPNGEGKAIGFITHIDTAPDACGDHVNPWVLENYDGSDIILNKEKNIVMKATEFPNLLNYIGQDLILTDGTTLLGGDDKAGIAVVMTMAEYYLKHPEISHGMISLAFTPDEEVGGLAKDLDLERFGAPMAYTLDGDHLGYYIDQTFYAAGAILEITGLSVHTATAKGIMRNAVDIASEFLQMLPPMEKPQYTSGEEGFYHVVSCSSSCEYARVELIIRDFDVKKFEDRNNFIHSCAMRLKEKYGERNIQFDLYYQYRNIREVIKDYPFMIEYLKQAISESGLLPQTEPFRGGTDGSALSFRGLPCPNLSAGYENAHGRFEYVSIQSMMKNVEILLRLCDKYAKA
jgi:tripeptide aminopeptidase